MDQSQFPYGDSPYATQPSPSSKLHPTQRARSRLPFSLSPDDFLSPYHYPSSPSVVDSDDYSYASSVPDLEPSTAYSAESYNHPFPATPSSLGVHSSTEYGLHTLPDPEGPQAPPRERVNNLIKHAILGSPQQMLTSNEICKAIRERFPVYASDEIKWKNLR